MKKYLKFFRALKSAPVLLVLGVEIGIGIVVSFFTSVVFFKMTDLVIDKNGFGFDAQISQTIYRMRTPLLTSLMNFISLIGRDGILLFLTIIPLVFYLKKRKHEAVLFTIMIVMGMIINFLLKLITQRPRPDLSPLVLENSFSFPSGHSMNSFVFFMTTAYFIYRFTHKKKISLVAFAGSAIVIICVGVSRIYLGVHYPSDVLGGYLAGLLWIVSFLVIEKTLIFLKIFKNSI